jgi:hypothetical protein
LTYFRIHMAVVAGVVFFAVRALLALIPSLTVSFSHQEMVGSRSPCRRRVLSVAVRR